MPALPNNQEREAQRVSTLLTMFQEDGATAAGEAPPVDHIAALKNSNNPDDMKDVLGAFRVPEGPPERLL